MDRPYSHSVGDPNLCQHGRASCGRLCAECRAELAALRRVADAADLVEGMLPDECYCACHSGAVCSICGLKAALAALRDARRK